MDDEGHYFVSNLPKDLLESLTPGQRELLKAMNRIEQGMKWSIEKALESNSYLRELDVRVTPIEKWKQAINDNWRLVAGVFSIPMVIEVIHVISAMTSHKGP